MSTESCIFEMLNPPTMPTIFNSVKFFGSSSDDSITIDNVSKTITPSPGISIKYCKNDVNGSSVFFLPFTFDRMLLDFQQGIHTENLMCSLSTEESFSSFKVSSPTKLPFSNNCTGLITLTIKDTSDLLLKVQFYRKPISSSFNKEASTNTNYSEIKPGEKQSVFPSLDDSKKKSNPFPIPIEDGPLFRDAINTYEQLTPLILKQIYSSSHKSSTADAKSTEHSKFAMGSLKDFSKGLLPLAPRYDALLSKFDASSSSTDEFTQKSLKALRKCVSDPKIDFAIIKPLQNFNSSKKIFEDDSKKYYDWLSKLMGSGKSKDEKLLTKMKSFQIKQINYFNYLYDMVTPVLISLVKPDQKLIDKYWQDKVLREEAGKRLINCSNMEEFRVLMNKYSVPAATNTSLVLVDPTSTYHLKFQQKPLKSGLLFVHGGQGKSGWHKQWLVLCEGGLYEYMDWRRGTDLRNKPLDISMCNVKLIDNVDNCNSVSIGPRKNCFRVINPQGVEHVFQAFTLFEAKEWVKALNEAGQMKSYRSGNSARSNSKPPSKPTDKETINAGVERKQVNRMRRVSSVSLSLLNIVRTADSSNRICADCGATEQVDWISINLLIVFCIQCSSAHRSLGTSISKVRSLTLDSFGPEHRVLITQINNHRMNELYESRLPANLKPSPNTDHESRLKFITDKYVKKYFVDDETRNNAKLSLREGVRDDDVYKVLRGLAGGANVNTKFHYTPGTVSSSASILSSSQIDPNRKLEVTYLEYSLLHPSVLDGTEVFDVAELLALNGCDVGSQVRRDSLVNEKARKWWQERIDKMNGKGPALVSSAGKGVSPKIAPLASPRSSQLGSKPTLVLPSNAKQPEYSSNSRSKIRSPKDGFNLFKKKIRNLD